MAEYTKGRRITFEQQQELNRIRNSAMGTACNGLTTAELKELNPNLLRAAPKMREALKEVKLVWPGLDPNRTFPHLEEVINQALAEGRK